MKPFATIYSTFLQRALDQIFQEVSLHSLPVRFCIDRAGLVGGDGAVHQGFLDIALLKGFPKMALMAAIDEPTLRAGMQFLHGYEDGPSALRYPRESVPEPVEKNPPPFELGKAHMLADGHDLAILAYGFPVHNALEARATMEKDGHSVRVYDGRFAKPVDWELVRDLLAADIPILTVEDHGITGGFGACVLEACNDHRLPTTSIHRLGLPDRWIYHGSRAEQQAEAGIDANGIVATARRILEKTTVRNPRRTAHRVGRAEALG